MTDIKQAANALRSALKAEGIRGRVRVLKVDGVQVVEVGNMTMVKFSPEEIVGFCTAAKNLGFTMNRRREIDPVALSVYTNKNWWNFYVR